MRYEKQHKKDIRPERNSIFILDDKPDQKYNLE